MKNKLECPMACVDIGSNSIKALVAKTQRNAKETKLIELYKESHMTGLGRELANTGKLSPQALEKTFKALESIYKNISKKYPLCPFEIIATAATREASNKNELLEFIEKLFSKKANIIDGLEEAKLSALGALSSFPKTDLSHSFFVDLGGASTEISFFERGEFRAVSTSLGAAKTHHALKLGKDPFNPQQIKELQNYIQDTLSKELPKGFTQELRKKTIGIAVGGTLVMTAKSLETYPKINFDDFFNFNQKCFLLSEKQRQDLPKISKDRADILPTGLEILIQILKIAKVKECNVTSRGIRHGLFFC